MRIRVMEFSCLRAGTYYEPFSGPLLDATMDLAHERTQNPDSRRGIGRRTHGPAAGEAVAAGGSRNHAGEPGELLGLPAHAAGGDFGIHRPHQRGFAHPPSVPAHAPGDA